MDYKEWEEVQDGQKIQDLNLKDQENKYLGQKQQDKYQNFEQESQYLDHKEQVEYQHLDQENQEYDFVGQHFYEIKI